MPAEAPGKRYSVIATKQVNHGDPTVELNHAGIAAKSSQIAPMVPSVANAALAVQILVGEEFVIMLGGQHEVATSKLYASPAVGDQIYIRPSDNSFHKAGATVAGDVKFGVIDDIDTVRAVAHVNLDQRGSF